MRLFLILAAILLIVALICFAVPTAVIGGSGFVWLSAGLLSWVLDALLGGYVVPVARA